MPSELFKKNHQPIPLRQKATGYSQSTLQPGNRRKGTEVAFPVHLNLADKIWYEALVGTDLEINTEFRKLWDSKGNKELCRGWGKCVLQLYFF